MGPELLGIKPRHELKFTFELKKQSSCSVQLVNNSDQYVAFKVKTTSPRKYSVRPNIGVIQPSSSCDFTVIMQAQREAPPDFQCKDKFLIQSTVVPVGTTLEDITSSTFSKDNNEYVEENKLRVVLVGPPNSPVLLPISGTLEKEPSNESPILSVEENLPPPHTVITKDVKVLELAKDVKNLTLPENVEDLKPANEVKELKSKLTKLESKLREAEITLRMLKEEKTTTIKERQTLQEALVSLKRDNNGVRRVQVGFPFLFVCMVSLVSMTLGYVLRRW